jgi:hypothetical protein
VLTIPHAFSGYHIEHSTGLVLAGEEYTPHAQSIMIRWGANNGNIIFPGDWFDFYGNGLPIHVPDLSVIQDPTYLLRAELFTMNSQSKEILYSIRRQPLSDDFELLVVNPLTYNSFIGSFWETYHQARKAFIPNSVDWRQD